MSKNTPNALRFETLTGVIKKLPVSPDNTFLNLFGVDQEESDTIRWGAEYGTVGMTPFAAPGAPAPVTTDDTFYGEGSARAAFFKEKRYFDEQFLNNLQDPMDPFKRKKAEQVLAENLQKMNYRIDRRREWMLAQMLFRGGFTYTQEKGLRLSVDYGIPSTHKLQLVGNDVWGTGSTRNPVEDIFDMKKILSDDAGVSPEYTITTTEVIKMLMFDSNVQELLKKSTFGDGNLFANPAPVLASLLGVGEIRVYDAKYEIRSFLAATASATNTFVVEDTTDMEVGGTLRIVDMSKNRVWEDLTISAINHSTMTITTSAACTGTYRVGRDIVIMKKPFVDPYSFMMFNTMAEGKKVAKVMEAPYGIPRRYGKYADSKMEWDPDGVWIRVQDKALPVLYNPETIITMKVK